MSTLAEQLHELDGRFAAALSQAGDAKALEEVRVGFLGRSGEVTALRRGIGQLPVEERPTAGKVINEVVEGMEAKIAAAESALAMQHLGAELQHKIDVTFPSIEPATGSIHPITTDNPLPLGTSTLGLFALLTAFSNGCTAMTGVEAVSNGVPAFRKPRMLARLPAGIS